VELPVSDPVVVVAIVAGVIVASPILLERYRIPGVIGVLIAGALLGPNALGILARDQAIVLLGTMGLIYIMFTAALEIDLAVLKRSRVQSIGFGLITFSIPQGVGTVVGHYLLGFDWPAAVLLASMFASHTLLAYPLASRLGLSKNRAVTAALGGTIVTDTLALLVLAVVASSTNGELTRAFWMKLAVSMAVYVGGILILVPQLARWFFRNVRPDGPVEFMFVLATVFTCAGLSHGAGLEPIVGAFLAGLALNRSIPHQSPLMNRIAFTGDALFVPFFLLSVGMLLDVRIFLGGARSWLISIAMVGCVIVCKYAAAELARLVFRYERAEARVMFGLSLAQAAATLAAVMVGYRIGLFDDAVVNGAILMMLVTCIWSPILVDRHGRTLAVALECAPSAAEGQPQRILLSLSNAETAPPLIGLALLLRDEGQNQPIYPFTVVRETTDTREAVAYAEKMLSHAVVHCTSADVPSRPVTRIDHNVAAALNRAQRELRVSDIVMGWSHKATAQERLFGSFLEHLLEDRDFTLWMARIKHPLNTTGRVILCAPPHGYLEPGFAAAAHAIKRLASQLAAPLVVYGVREEADALGKRLDDIKPDLDHQRKPVEAWSGLVNDLGGWVADRDLLILYAARPGALSFSPRAERLAQRVAGRLAANNLLVVYPGEPAQVADAGMEVKESDVPSFLREDRIVFGLDGVSFEDAVAAVLEEGLAGHPDAPPPEQLLPDVVASATPLTDGVVLLHATCDMQEPIVLLGSSQRGLARTGGPAAHLLFVVLSPPAEDHQSHLNRLAEIARVSGSPGLVERIARGAKPGDLLATLAGTARNPEPEADESAESARSDGPVAGGLVS
jgi:Kef-type K+ transport system membrane component KefB